MSHPQPARPARSLPADRSTASRDVHDIRALTATGPIPLTRRTPDQQGGSTGR